MIRPCADELQTIESRTPKFTEKQEDIIAKVKTKEAEHAEIEEELKTMANEAGALEPLRQQEKASVHEKKLQLKDVQVCRHTFLTVKYCNTVY